MSLSKQILLALLCGAGLQAGTITVNGIAVYSASAFYPASNYQCSNSFSGNGSETCSGALVHPIYTGYAATYFASADASADYGHLAANVAVSGLGNDSTWLGTVYGGISMSVDDTISLKVTGGSGPYLVKIPVVVTGVAAVNNNVAGDVVALHPADLSVYVGGSSQSFSNQSVDLGSTTFDLWTRLYNNASTSLTISFGASSGAQKAALSTSVPYTFDQAFGWSVNVGNVEAYKDLGYYSLGAQVPDLDLDVTGSTGVPYAFHGTLAPEPATDAMIGGGLLVLTAVARRFRRTRG
jgi:hypothetical protein